MIFEKSVKLVFQKSSIDGQGVSLDRRSFENFKVINETIRNTLISKELEIKVVNL